MRRAALLRIAIVLAVAACDATPTTAPTATADATAGPDGGVVGRIYVFLGTPQGASAFVPVERDLGDAEPGGPPAAAALAALLAGPTEAELGASPAIFTAIGPGVRVLGLGVEAGVATVNLSEEINDIDRFGDFQTIRARLAQIVFTLTQFPAITGVLFETAGAPQDVIDLERNLLFRPVTRMDYVDLLPPVFLDEPAWGATIDNPGRLTGLANVFEATFHVRILDPGGRALADGPVMATCGTGCWGTFEASVPYTVAAAGPGVLQTYELSAVDGSIVNLIAYPVVLTP